MQFKQQKFVYQEALLLEVDRALNCSRLQSRKLRPANFQKLPSRRIIDHHVIGIKASSESI
ncbi:unnamed protein product [Coffea canephora]|uniref:Uncharacterized protein n=1 Tax=Coffea canephora TaxID=49390 RepID=A0A068U9E1_COFCA|nr:unnamed protein product [Coffea canephora]